MRNRPRQANHVTTITPGDTTPIFKESHTTTKHHDDYTVHHNNITQEVVSSNHVLTL
jgi:hypothetical protein